MATQLLPTVVPWMLKIQDYFGELFGAYTSQTSYVLLHGVHVKMSCQQKSTFVAEKFSLTQPVKIAD